MRTSSSVIGVPPPGWVIRVSQDVQVGAASPCGEVVKRARGHAPGGPIQAKGGIRTRPPLPEVPVCTLLESEYVLAIHRVGWFELWNTLRTGGGLEGAVGPSKLLP